VVTPGVAGVMPGTDPLGDEPAEGFVNPRLLVLTQGASVDLQSAAWRR
jgi:hypothetical protein